MKILFVAHSMKVGGATKQLAITANFLMSMGNEVSIYLYSSKGVPASSLNSKIKVYIEREIPSSAMKEYLTTPKKIRKKVKQIAPDVVIGWRTNAGCLVAIGCLGLNIKTVFCERSDPFMEDTPMLHIAKYICNLNRGGIFQTEQAKNYYRLLAKKSIVIPNPYSVDEKFPDVVDYDCRNKDIAFVGRFEIIQKRQDIMLSAFELFYQKHPDYTLSFYGDGKGVEEIRKLAESKGLANNVLFHGIVKDIISRLSRSKLMVLTSDYEGIPNVILEAFAAGTPVVTTDCSPGGARVLIEDGINGFIVPRRDYKTIAQKMEEIITNEDIAYTFIKNGRNKLTQFTPNVIFEKWCDYLHKL